MNELISLLPDFPTALLVPVIMLITAASVAVVVVGIKALVRLIVRVFHSIIHKRSAK